MRTKKKTRKNNLAYLDNKKVVNNLFLYTYITNVRKEYGLRKINNKTNIQEGLQHLNEQTRNNPKGISLTIVNMSDSEINVQYKDSFNNWINPKINEKGKDKFSWDNIQENKKFPKIPLPSIRQITAYVDKIWRILYKDTSFEFLLELPKKSGILNKYILFFTNKKDKRLEKVTKSQLETFIKNHIEQTSKVNIEDGLKAKWS